MTTCRCPACGLSQWIVPSAGVCRRCKAPLGFSVLEIPLSNICALRNDSNAPELGRALRSLRLRQGVTQSQLARSAMLGRSHLSRIESGIVPKMTTFVRLLRSLGVDTLYIRVKGKPR